MDRYPMTPEGHEALTQELKHLTSVERPRISKEIGVAREHGESPRFVAAWLSLRVHSALDAVGLTAAVSRALADAGIACNVLAGFHHDHLLVPAARRADAIAALHALRGN